eukprot:gene14460-15960_t
MSSVAVAVAVATNSDSDTPLQELPSTPPQPHMTPDTRRKMEKIVQNRTG